MKSDTPHLTPLNTTKTILLVIAGTLSVALGIVGAFLPVLPTTPFILLAALCYVRSSPRLYERLMRSRFAGDNVRNVLNGKGVPLSVKVFSLTVSALMIAYVSVFVTESFLLRMMLGLVYGVQLIFMMKVRTLRR